MATAVAAKTLTVLKKSMGKQLTILTTVNTFLLSLWAQMVIPKNAQLEGSKQDFRNQRSYELVL